MLVDGSENRERTKMYQGFEKSTSKPNLNITLASIIIYDPQAIIQISQPCLFSILSLTLLTFPDYLKRTISDKSRHVPQGRRQGLDFEPNDVPAETESQNKPRRPDVQGQNRRDPRDRVKQHQIGSKISNQPRAFNDSKTCFLPAFYLVMMSMNTCIAAELSAKSQIPSRATLIHSARPATRLLLVPSLTLVL